MRHVTVYVLKETKVVVHDGQDAIKRTSLLDIGMVHNSPGEYINKAECEYKEVRLPIKRYCTVGKEDIYVAFDHEVLKLLNISGCKVQLMLDQKAREIALLEEELESFEGMTAWEALKFAGKKFLQTKLEKK